MEVLIRPLSPSNMAAFKSGMQEAFQKGAEEGLGPQTGEILPESHILRSLGSPGALAYEALADGKILGGAIVVISPEGDKGELHFLYVKAGNQGRGIGQKIWKFIEEEHAGVKLWETCTPYFDKRNLHLYINCLGFAAVEFYNPHHKMPGEESEVGSEDCFFRFQKRARKKDSSCMTFTTSNVTE